MCTSHNSTFARQRKTGDFRNQRAAAIGVDIGAILFRGAHFTDASQRLQPLQQLGRLLAEAHAQQISAGHRRFQFVRRAESDDAAVIDDGEALAERVGFFHVVRGQQNGFAALVVLANDFPEQQSRLRIEAGARLVEEEHLRIVHHGARDGEALHHAAGESADHLVGAVGQLEAVEKRCGATCCARAEPRPK